MKLINLAEITLLEDKHAVIYLGDFIFSFYKSLCSPWCWWVSTQNCAPYSHSTSGLIARTSPFSHIPLFNFYIMLLDWPHWSIMVIALTEAWGRPNMAPSASGAHVVQVYGPRNRVPVYSSIQGCESCPVLGHDSVIVRRYTIEFLYVPKI